MLDRSFWLKKRVLITGHTGFKGSWLSLWLLSLGARVYGISLPPSTSPDLFSALALKEGIAHHEQDIRDIKTCSKIISDIQPDIIFHMAAQPLVRRSYHDPVETFTTNLTGTLSVLEALRLQSRSLTAVFVTTDKVYKNQEGIYPFRETDQLGGHDPYSASKAASEIIISSYRDAFLSAQDSAIASARAGNVIGGGDWSEDRLIPDAIRAWDNNETLNIRFPNAVRPWQHVLDALYGYLKLAEQLALDPRLAGSYNFGPSDHQTATVGEVIEKARSIYGGAIHYAGHKNQPRETLRLALDVSKSKIILGIKERWNLETSIDRTMRWYKNYKNGADPLTLCRRDIETFSSEELSL